MSDKLFDFLVSYTTGRMDDPQHGDVLVKAPNIKVALESVLNDGIDLESINSIEQED